MPARPSWNGVLKLSLVSCAVSLYGATTQSEKITFNLLNRATGSRVRQRYVDAETEDEVPRDDLVKGFRTEDGAYLVFEDDELDAIEIDSSKTIEIDRFVKAETVDRIFLDDFFFVAPDDKLGADAFAVIRDAMAEKGVVGIGRIVMHRREKPVLLEPRGRGILAITLRYAYEVRSDAPYLGEIADQKASEEMVDLAGYIIDRKTGDFDPDAFEDRYQNALADLVEAKSKGRAAAPRPAAGAPGNVVNLMDALKKSIAREGGEERPRRGGASGSGGRREGEDGGDKPASRKRAKGGGSDSPPRKAAGGRRRQG